MTTRDDLAQHLRLAMASYGAALELPAAALPREPEPSVTAVAAPAPAATGVATPSQPPGDRAGPAPGDLDELRELVLQCTGCKLADHRTRVVFGDGGPGARVMFIGEAPGYHEDQQGRPFVGRAGQLLDRIIENAMGLRRSDVYIANVNKCRPPDNRDPQPDEVAACLPHLREQIRFVGPEVIVTLGRIAAHNLLGTDQPMRRLRGQELSYQGIPVVATWHPAYLLRNEAAKVDTWNDIKRVNRLLGHPERPQPASGRE